MVEDEDEEDEDEDGDYFGLIFALIDRSSLSTSRVRIIRISHFYSCTHSLSRIRGPHVFSVGAFSTGQAFSPPERASNLKSISTVSSAYRILFPTEGNS
ncbi:hypothetical protein K3495_g9963 [Podosphaera aphanis]|nr:hypothetical protein K3495_g9963 [Podosphaera aphanis]